MREPLQEEALRGAGFVETRPPAGFGELWRSYRCEDGGCTGWFHVFSPGSAPWSISIHDFTMRGDFVMDLTPPRYLTVTWFKSIAGMELSPRRRLRPDSVCGQSIGAGPWAGVAPGGVPAQCVAIEVTPEFSARFLDDEYPDRFRGVERAFISLESFDEFPEMRTLLSRLWPRPGDRERSSLYYEGKVLQAMGLIVERSRHPRVVAGRRRVAPGDRERMRDVLRYIDDHCCADLRIDDLARMACMSPTKFKETFRRLNGRTLTRYVQGRRMSRAELLLRRPELTIGRVARTVGYTSASRFAALFKRDVGVLPSEYRERLDV